MNRHVRAATPVLYKLAQKSKYASLSAEMAPTHFVKKAHILELDGVNDKLVNEAIKLGGAVLQSLSANKQSEILGKQDEKKKLSDEEDYLSTKESMSIGKALATGAALSAAPALTASYMLNRASDDVDAKMLAIPGLAAATVGAILAARKMTSPSNTVSSEDVGELEAALKAKTVVDSAMTQVNDSDTQEDLKKKSSISTEHIASLIAEFIL